MLTRIWLKRHFQTLRDPSGFHNNIIGARPSTESSPPPPTPRHSALLGVLHCSFCCAQGSGVGLDSGLGLAPIILLWKPEGSLKVSKCLLSQIRVSMWLKVTLSLVFTFHDSLHLDAIPFRTLRVFGEKIIEPSQMNQFYHLDSNSISCKPCTQYFFTLNIVIMNTIFFFFLYLH